MNKHYKATPLEVRVVPIWESVAEALSKYLSLLKDRLAFVIFLLALRFKYSTIIIAGPNTLRRNFCKN